MTSINLILGGVSCAIDGCDKPVNARGWCSSHYRRWQRHGNPLAGGTVRGAPAEFIEKAVSYSGEDCLIWPFSTDTVGYARAYTRRGNKPVARIICERVHGNPPSAEHHAAHSCGKGHLGCINPGHLRWATPLENAQDKFIHGTVLMGEKSPRAKLSESQVREIIDLGKKLPGSRIAELFQVHPTTVRKIVAGQRWSCLKESVQ